MMKKGLSILLILLLVLTACPAVCDRNRNASDVAGTSYEEAVNALSADGIISGFPAVRFVLRRGSRRRLCIIAVKTMGATDETLAAAAAAVLLMLSGYDWAVKYINYAVAKGVVSGYPDGTFRPGDEVTYNEMAAMLTCHGL